MLRWCVASHQRRIGGRESDVATGMSEEQPHLLSMADFCFGIILREAKPGTEVWSEPLN